MRQEKIQGERRSATIGTHSPPCPSHRMLPMLSMSTEEEEVVLYVKHNCTKFLPYGVALVAQLVEHSPRLQSVVGSNPT